MKHCKNCSRCTEDLVARYITQFAEYKCMIDHHPIDSPFWEGRDCEYYHKEGKGSK